MEKNYFNTSNVNVYHIRVCLVEIMQCYFNTSNVNVYQKKAHYNRNYSKISIHLMVMFII